MKKPHLSIVSSTDKPTKPKPHRQRIFCYTCNKYPTMMSVKTFAPEENECGEWMVRSGTRLLVCDGCGTVVKQR